MPSTESSSATEPRHWQVFAAAPHRMMFFAGAVQAVLAMGLWLSELLGRAGYVPPLPMVMTSTGAHIFLMLFGLFPFFIFGFLLTVYPRWMGGPVVPVARYVTAFLMFAAGMIFFYVGLFTSRAILVAALALQLIGWGIGLYSLLAVFRQAPKRGPHERLLNFALFAAMGGIASFLYGVLSGSADALRLARELGLWLFLVPVVFTISHRMIPFFSSTVLDNYTVVRPSWSLPLLVVGVIGHAALDIQGRPQWLFVADAPLLFMALHHSLLWQFRRSFQVRLLAMLHIAFLWFGLAMVLYMIQSIVLLASHVSVLGRAPLHALGIGFITSMMVAMVSRVTLGHSGRALQADDLTWRVLFGVNFTAVLRITAEVVPGNTASTLNIIAALAWLASLSPWVWHYVPMYLRPRVDGKPG